MIRIPWSGELVIVVLIVCVRLYKEDVSHSLDLLTAS